MFSASLSTVLPLILVMLPLTMLLCMAVLHFFPKWGLMDRPERYGHKRAPIPYPGGAALLVAFAIGFLIFFQKTPLTWALFGATLLLGLVAFWDDRRGLSPFLRLGVQMSVALMLVAAGLELGSIGNPFGGVFVLDAFHWTVGLGPWAFTLAPLSILVTVVWIMVMINALNWIDGVPGMASGNTAVASAVLLMLSARPEFHFVDQTLSLTLSALLLSLSFGFVFFDFPKPKMLLGDTGSMVFGFLLAILALISGGKVATTALVLGFPFLDFFWVILRRIWRGQSPFKGDLGHFHHRLQQAGYSDRAVVLFFVFSSMTFGSFALLLQSEGKFFALVGVFVMMVFSALLLYSKSASD